MSIWETGIRNGHRSPRTLRDSGQRRRSRARARRIQRRLDQVKRDRAARERQSLHGQATGAPGSQRGRAIGLFAGSVFLGLLLAKTAVPAGLHWWNEDPPRLLEIAVLGNDRLQVDEIARALALTPGTPLSTLSSVELVERIVRHPWIRSAQLVALPTGTLIVRVEERRPHAVILDPKSGTRSFVDPDGVVFAAVDAGAFGHAEAIPTLVANSHPGVGSDAAAIRASLSLGEVVRNLELRGLARPGAPHRGLELVLPEADDPTGWILRRAADTRRDEAGQMVILGDGSVAEVTDRLVRLDQMLAAPLGEVQRATSIDLRFAGQAVLRGVETSAL